MYDKEIEILNDVGNQSSAVQSIIDDYDLLYAPDEYTEAIYANNYIMQIMRHNYTAAKDAYDKLYESYESITDISGNVISLFAKKNLGRERRGTEREHNGFRLESADEEPLLGGQPCGGRPEFGQRRSRSASVSPAFD